MSMKTTKRWVCTICGYVHEGPEPPESCPECGASSDLFEEEGAEDGAPSLPGKAVSGEYLAKWARESDAFETKFARIKSLASGAPSEISPMRTQQPFPSWEAVLFRGAQLHRLPLNEHENVNTKTVIGRTAARPLTIAMPFYVSHMSFGALSREAKIALARGSRLAGTLICSGEGGLLPVERAEAALYVYELGTAPFSHRDDAIRQADAVEIKIGQAAKPGLGGHLPKEKVTEEIARVRGISVGEDSISPGRFTGIDKKGDLKKVAARVRGVLDGKPLGVKLTASHIEEDLAEALEAEPDFITIDCRGGATGAAPTYLKDNVCLPPVFALYRARKYLTKPAAASPSVLPGDSATAPTLRKPWPWGPTPSPSPPHRSLPSGANSTACATPAVARSASPRRTPNCGNGLTSRCRRNGSRTSTTPRAKRWPTSPGSTAAPTCTTSTCPTS